jgi:uncharacterized protein YbjT (DUF2867 family)
MHRRLLRTAFLADVASLMADVAIGEPVNAALEIAGPQRVGMAALLQRYLKDIGDSRTVVFDSKAPYFGVQVDDRSLTPGQSPRLGRITYEDWLARAR